MPSGWIATGAIDARDKSFVGTAPLLDTIIYTKFPDGFFAARLVFPASPWLISLIEFCRILVKAYEILNNGISVTSSLR